MNAHHHAIEPPLSEWKRLRAKAVTQEDFLHLTELCRRRAQQYLSLSRGVQGAQRRLLLNLSGAWNELAEATSRPADAPPQGTLNRR